MLHSGQSRAEATQDMWRNDDNRRTRLLLKMPAPYVVSPAAQPNPVHLVLARAPVKEAQN